jgi:hypothetical protein
MKNTCATNQNILGNAGVAPAMGRRGGVSDTQLVRPRLEVPSTKAQGEETTWHDVRSPVSRTLLAAHAFAPA